MMGGLRLDRPRAVQKGGKSGPPIVPGKPDESLLIQAIRQTHERIKMPPGGKLTDKDIADLTEWVKPGAAWPAGSKAPETPKTAEYRDHARASRVLVVRAGAQPAVPPVKGKELGADSDRQLHSGGVGREGSQTGASGGQANADPPRDRGSHRTASHAEEVDEFRRRQIGGRIRQGGRPPPGIAALRRALGPPLAGYRALCRRQSEPASRRKPIRMHSAIAIG